MAGLQQRRTISGRLGGGREFEEGRDFLLRFEPFYESPNFLWPLLPDSIFFTLFHILHLFYHYSLIYSVKCHKGEARGRRCELLIGTKVTGSR